MSRDFWKKLKKPILALAPMAGVSDSAFRQLCREYGADVVYTEMVSADGLFYDSKKTLEFLKFKKNEHPVVIQLFGKHPEKFTKAAQVCEQAGFDGIDINFGCPAKKVAGHGGGVTLMRDLPKCRQIIEAVLAGTRLPVSVKLRSSILSFRPESNRHSRLDVVEESLNYKDSRDPSTPLRFARDDKEKKTGSNEIKITALDFIKFMKDLPLSAVMIHGRPYENPFNAEIDYEMIKAVKKEFNGVVLGNGGIKTPEDAKKMMEETGVDGVGLARGLYGRPWFFGQIRDYFKKGKYSEPKPAVIKEVILQHAKLAFAEKNNHGIVELRKHLSWYVGGYPGARELRAKLVRVENVGEIKEILKNFK